MLTALAMVSLVLSDSAAAGDEVDKAWKARAERAAKKLAQPGLDECDRAVEVAFQNAKVESKGGRLYPLEIHIGTERLLVGYHYEGTKLKDFSLYGVPAKWMVHQPVASKTISVVLGDGPRCAFDLCSNDPFSDGPCAEKK